MLETIVDVAVPLIASGALFLNWRALRANARAIDTASYTKLADRIDAAYDGFRLARRQQKAGVGIGKAELRYAAERLLAVIADSCHLYLSGLLPPATAKMVAEYLDTILPLDYCFLREIARDVGEGDPYRHIREFGERRNNDTIVGQFPRGSDMRALPQGSS